MYSTQHTVEYERQRFSINMLQDSVSDGHNLHSQDIRMLINAVNELTAKRTTEIICADM